MLRPRSKQHSADNGKGEGGEGQEKRFKLYIKYNFLRMACLNE